MESMVFVLMAVLAHKITASMIGKYRLDVLALLIIVFTTVWLILGLGFTPEYEISTKTQQLYVITENGQSTDYYGKLLPNRDIVVNYGDTQKVCEFSDMEREYGGKAYIEIISYTWDDDKFPNNMFPTVGKCDDIILHIGDIK